MNSRGAICVGIRGLRLIAFTAVFCFSTVFQAAAAALDEISGGDITLAEYDPTNLSLNARVHAARLFTDYERRGFFRIGLLPVPVADDVQVQIQSAAVLTNACMMLQTWRDPAVVARRFEFRNLKIFLLGESRPRLCASRARLGKDGALEFFDASVTSVDGRRMFIKQATFQAAGQNAGRLMWSLNGRAHELFPFGS